MHLTGYDLSLEDLRQFRQWGSKTPGHPERRHTAGIEVTTGPLGQGFANAVGMAVAERVVRNRFGSEVCDHHTYVIAGDGCFMEGVSHEAASLAGHLGLGRLIAFYDDNHITIDGPTELAYDDNVEERFEAYGWRVHNLGEMANDVDALEAAIREALDHPADGPDAKPNLLVLRSHIGWPSPKLTDSADAHGNPFGEDEIRVTKEILGLPPDETFWVPDEVREFYAKEIVRGAADRSAWEERFAAWDGDRAAWEAAQAGRGVAGWADALPSFEAGTKLATRRALNQCLNATAAGLPGLVAGSADLTGNNGVLVKDAALQSREDQGGVQLHYGIREFGMAAAMNGMAAHGGVLPLGGTFFCLLRLHAPRRPPGCAQPGARRLFLDARFHRTRRGRTDAPADRAAGLAAGHARHPHRAAGRRQRDGDRLEAGHRGGRPRWPRPDPPGRARPRRYRGEGGRGRPPWRVRACRFRRGTRGGAAWARAAKSSTAWARPRSWPARAWRPGSSR